MRPHTRFAGPTSRGGAWTCTVANSPASVRVPKPLPDGRSQPVAARVRSSVELVRIYEPSGGYGFPSTTALLSVVLLGTICYLAWQERPRRPFVAVLLCVSLLSVLANGISRVYVGEHWAADILGGWPFGSVWLLILLAIHRWWFSKQGRPRMPR